MAAESTASEVETSFWGLPTNWDGHEPKQYQFFVETVDLIAEEGWKYMFHSTNTGWAITPTRSRNAIDNE